MAWAEKQYHHCLLDSPEAEPARRYLQERGITPESIETFQLGFSPAGTRLDSASSRQGRERGKNRRRAKILEADRHSSPRPAEGGSFYDRFKGRLLFSIRDAQGRPVGIGGRVLPELGTTSPAKYVNSPETPLFTKSKLLYGLDLARQAIRKNGTALVMEGYTDVIVAHQYGFNNAVAVLGTALGAEHIQILKHYADRIVLVLDGDEAGQKRTNEVLELFVAQQVDLRILTLPEGLDPCDFLHKNGAEAFAELLANSAVDALEHAFATVTRGVDVDRDIHGASRALERLVSIVAKAPRLRADTTARRPIPRRKNPAAAGGMVPRGRRRSAPAADGAQAAEPRSGDKLFHQRAEAAAETPVRRTAGNKRSVPARVFGTADGPSRVPAECARTTRRRSILALGCAGGFTIHVAGWPMTGVEPSFDRLMLEFDEPAVKSLLVELDETSQAKGNRAGDPQELLSELINTFKRKETEKQRPGQIVALREGGLDENRQIDMLEEILRQERNRQGITKPTDG